MNTGTVCTCTSGLLCLLLFFAGRKAFNRDKPPTPRSQHITEDHNSTAVVGTGGGSGRKRQSGSHHSSREGGGGGGKHSSTRSGGSAVQVKGQPVELERGGEGGGTVRGHTNRHSWDPETAMQYQHSGTAGSTKTSGDVIERSLSARFDRVTDTNNRFERLNPDTEAPGDTQRAGSTRSRKRNSRSASGSSSYRSRSPKRKSGKESKEHKASSGSGHTSSSSSAEKVTLRDNETASATNCDLEWDSSVSSSQQQSDGDIMVNGAVPLKDDQGLTSPVTAGPPRSQLEKVGQVTAVDKTSGASAQGSVEHDDPSSPTSAAAREEEEEEVGEKGECDITEKTKSRLSYSRVSHCLY